MYLLVSGFRPWRNRRIYDAFAHSECVSLSLDLDPFGICYSDLANKTFEQIDGRTIYFVSRSELSPKILERFTNKKILSIVREPVYVDLERVLYIYRLSGFKGY